jgi:hypothetical protein
LCIASITMKSMHAVPVSCFVGGMFLIGAFGCRSLPGRENLTAQQVALIRADSEVFEAVVRAQLAGNMKDYPYHLDGLRYDSRPSTPVAAFPITAPRSKKPGATGPFEAPDSAMMDRLAANRKQILKRAAVEESGPPKYSNCAGMLVPPPPPAVGSPSASTNRPGVHASCPRDSESYVTVSLPIRGQPEVLKLFPNPKGRRLNITGELWTVVVEVNSAGPNGSMWSQNAWVLRRIPSSRRLELADTNLLGVIE